LLITIKLQLFTRNRYFPNAISHTFVSVALHQKSVDSYMLFFTGIHAPRTSVYSFLKVFNCIHELLSVVSYQPKIEELKREKPAFAFKKRCAELTSINSAQVSKYN
jgi:hypothetical protein